MSVESHSLRTRPAVAADLESIAAIYNEGMADRTATFETQPRTGDDLTGWLGGHHPVIVVEAAAPENGNGVVAFAATSTYRARACYAGVAEFSVYVARSIRGRGAGRLAMDALIEAARAAGFWKLVSRVFPENTASRALLRSLGFREVGTYERHAQLEGEWRDVLVVERLLPTNQVGSRGPVPGPTFGQGGNSREAPVR